MSLSRTLLLSLIVSPSAWSAIGEVEHQDVVETIVVSGTKTHKLLSNSPVAVDVIAGETLAKISKGTLASTLDFIPGVVVSRSVKDGYNIMMNGFESKHVLVLVDGQRLIAPTGSAVDLDQINVENIAQIEIIKGASSVMYGSNAMGGVINIITDKSEHHSLSYEMGSYLSNSLEGDDDNAYSQLVNFSANTQMHGWDYQFAAKFIQDAGFDYDKSTIAHDSGALDKSFVNVAAHRQLVHLNTSVKYQYFNDDKSRPIGSIPGQSKLRFYTSTVDQHQADVAIEDIVQNWKLNARFMDHTEQSGQSGSLRDTQIGLSEVNGLKSWQFGNVTPKGQQLGIEVVTGFESRYDTLSQQKLGQSNKEIDDKDRTNVSLYGQVNWIKQSYQVLLGTRLQDDSDFGLESASRLSAMFNFGSKYQPFKLRMGIGQGYRVPDLKERFYQFDHSNLGYMVFGNSELQPELSTNINLSLDHRSELFNGAVSYSATVSAHYDQIKDLIDLATDVEQSKELNLDISHYINIAEASLHGFDLSNELSLQNWTWQINYTYLEAFDQDDVRLEGRPRHQIKTNLMYDFDFIDASLLLNVVFEDDKAIPVSYENRTPLANDSTVVNLKWNQTLTNNLNWHLALNNILDEHQISRDKAGEQYDPRPVSSRELRLGVTYQF